MRRHLAYGWYVLRHKWYVFLAACRLGVPWLGLIHDWSKLTPGEWFPYAQTFYTPQGKHQYIETEAFQRAWNHHQKANKHHWQYWMLTFDQGGALASLKITDGMANSKTVLLKMPERYAREMLADWIGAGRALGKPDTAAWYAKNKDLILLNPETRDWIELQLARMSVTVRVTGNI